MDGTKRLLPTSAIKSYVIPPKFDGIRVEQMWEQVKANPEWSCYFPDYLGRVPDKLYFFCVW